MFANKRTHRQNHKKGLVGATLDAAALQEISARITTTEDERN